MHFEKSNCVIQHDLGDVIYNAPTNILTQRGSVGRV